VRVAEIIDFRGLRKDWVAEQLGISPSYLTRLLAGERRWTPDLQKRIASILGLPAAFLFEHECPTNGHPVSVSETQIA